MYMYMYMYMYIVKNEGFPLCTTDRQKSRGKRGNKLYPKTKCFEHGFSNSQLTSIEQICYHQLWPVSCTVYCTAHITWIYVLPTLFLNDSPLLKKKRNSASLLLSSKKFLDVQKTGKRTVQTDEKRNFILSDKIFVKTFISFFLLTL